MGSLPIGQNDPCANPPVLQPTWLSVKDNPPPWVIGTLPKASKNWLAIPAKIRHSLEIPESMEKTTLALLSEWDMVYPPEAQIDWWSQLVLSNINRHSGKKTRHLIRFAMYTATVTPAEMPEVTQTDEGWIFIGTL